MKIIVVEGCDGTGKSTYVSNEKQIGRDCDLQVHSVHIDGKFPNTLKSYEELIMSYKCAKTVILIFDRAWIGEFVWSKKFRDGISRISKEEVQLLNDKYDIEYVMVENTTEKILKVFKERGEDALEHNEKTIIEIQNDFLDVFKTLNITPKRITLF